MGKNGLMVKVGYPVAVAVILGLATFGLSLASKADVSDLETATSKKISDVRDDQDKDQELFLFEIREINGHVLSMKEDIASIKTELRLLRESRGGQ